MADPLSVVGGLAAGMQLVAMAAETLLATIKLMRDLKQVPQRLAVLLVEVDNSISRLCTSCNAGSKVFQNIDHRQLDGLSRSTSALFTALQEIHGMLAPLISSNHGNGATVHRLWKSIVSLKVERELLDKLERLKRLNTEVLRELGVVGLEMQVTTKGLVMANNAASAEAFSNIETKMDSLRDDFQNFTLSVHRAHVVTLENSELTASGSQSRDPLHVEASSESDRMSDDSPNCKSATNSSSKLCSQWPPNEERLPQQRAEQMRRYLAGGVGGDPVSGLSMESTSRNPNANLEFVLFNIRTFYTMGNFDASPIVAKTQFWTDTDLAIYLMKVSKGADRGSSQSQNRGLRLLKKSTEEAPDTLRQSTATILVELLSTLSPINTATCPYVREALLQYLCEQAREQLPREHPIALVINKLRGDKGDKYVSIRSLTFIAERLRATLGPTHQLTQLATKRLCALLRRSGDFAETLRIAGDAVRALRALLGTGSLQERLLSRQVEHVYIDQCDWPAALSVCFDIVGQQLDSTNPDPLYHDECSVYTMEDISKICECAGNLEQATAWLKQARISGGMIWGQAEALAHIQDKLDELLKQTGKEDELELRSVSMDPNIQDK